MALRLRVGIVGCGYQGGWLAEAIGLSDAMVVTACADSITDRSVALANKLGHASAHGSLADLVAQADVDVIAVAVPPNLLAETCLQAIAAGKHVLGEKPVGMCEPEAELVERALAGSDVCFLAGYSFRYLPAWWLAHELLSSGAVGEIHSIMGRFTVEPLNKGWPADPACGGGPILLVGSHLIDQCLWYASDDPVEIYADLTRRPDTGAEATAAFQVAFARGAVAQCHVSQTADRLRYGLDVTGTAGTLSLRTAGFLDFEIAVQSSALEQYSEPTVIRPSVSGDPRTVMLSAQLRGFAAAIRNHTDAPVTIRDARRVLRVTDAILASDREGVPVHI